MKGFGWPLFAAALWIVLWPAHSALCPVWTPTRATEEIRRGTISGSSRKWMALPFPWFIATADWFHC